MRLSVILNTFNEGRRVYATCAQFLEAGADEVIVCADGTTDGSCDDLPTGTRVVRHETPQGCGKAKRTAAAAATGDVWMWVDAHQSVVAGDIRRLAQDALSGDHILCPALRNIYYDEHWHPHPLPSSDRLFYPNDAAVLPTHTNQYRFANPGTSVMVGVGLCMSRTTYDRVGGWNQFIGRHGSQERGMALRAYMAEVPVVIDDTVILGHEFYGETHPSRNRQTGQYRFNNIVPSAANVWHAYYVVSSPQTFETYFAPWLSTHQHAKAGRDIVTRTEVHADHHHFQHSCKRRSDADLVALLDRLREAHDPPSTPTTVV